MKPTPFLALTASLLFALSPISAFADDGDSPWANGSKGAVAKDSSGSDASDTTGSDEGEADELNDPLEPFNRAMFWFNDKVFVYILEPVAKGYHFITPRPVRNGIRNFFSNLRYPINLVSDIAQLKFEEAAEDTGRFAVNTTVGILGLMDPATDWGLPERTEDFGQALGYHGVGSGPYIVLPLLGPSNVRDVFGRAVDYFLDPTFYIGYTDVDDDTATAISSGLVAVRTIDQADRARKNIETAKEGAVDYYLFVQSAYNQSRRSEIYDGNPPDEEFGDDSDGSTVPAPAVQ